LAAVAVVHPIGIVSAPNAVAAHDDIAGGSGIHAVPKLISGSARQEGERTEECGYRCGEEELLISHGDYRELGRRFGAIPAELSKDELRKRRSVEGQGYKVLDG